MPHLESHSANRVGVLRAMVLGANDGIISTACLILGVAAADATSGAILTAGLAGLVAGATSMALGEYVSVSSQRDSEDADIAKETWELEHQPDHELEELTSIYVAKGLPQALAHEVAVELTKNDALKTHLAEELGINEHTRAQPIQAAVSSAAAFTVGSAIPLVTAAVASDSGRIVATIIVVIATLAALGFISARFGRATAFKPTMRVVVGGLVAMGFTMLVGSLFGTAIG